MLRKCTNEDLSDEECKNVIDPFYDNFDEYVITYFMPEVIAFYIASSFYRNAMLETTFFQHYNSAKDIFSINEKNYKKLKAEAIKLLRIRFSLEKISDILVHLFWLIKGLMFKL